MIHTETEFPFPGSIAEHDGQRWRVLQHMGANFDTALLSLIDGHQTCRAPVADLIDPRDVEDAVVAALIRPGEDEKKRALWIARHLRNQNEVTLDALERAMEESARAGRVTRCPDRHALAALLRKLGWRFTRQPTGTGTTRGLYTRAQMAEVA